MIYKIIALLDTFSNLELKIIESIFEIILNSLVELS